MESGNLRKNYKNILFSSTSKLLLASTDPNGPPTLARISFFVDTYFSRVQPRLVDCSRTVTFNKSQAT